MCKSFILERLQDVRHDIGNSDMRINNWKPLDAKLAESIEMLKKDIALDQEEEAKRSFNMQEIENEKHIRYDKDHED